jgi:predicted branched-subunit amino acid permease
VTAIEAGVLFISHAIYFILGKAAGLLLWSDSALPIIEFLITALFVWLYAKQVKSPVQSVPQE